MKTLLTIIAFFMLTSMLLGEEFNYEYVGTNQDGERVFFVSEKESPCKADLCFGWLAVKGKREDSLTSVVFDCDRNTYMIGRHISKRKGGKLRDMDWTSDPKNRPAPILKGSVADGACDIACKYR
jgi:hypothetical protein